MYRHIFVAVDSSPCSDYAVEAGLALARQWGARLTGCHAYAARLHDSAFRKMEAGLPPRYRDEEELARQREIHDGLIGKGLLLIARSMLKPLEERAKEAGVQVESRAVEGKNFAVLVQEIRRSRPDLVVMGAYGLGRVDRTILGSVCQRVTAAIDTDVLVMKNERPLRGAAIVVAVDGSDHAFLALRKAVELHRQFGGTLEAVHVFDPSFHGVAFRSIARTLSREAAQLFRFEEQQKLHDEVIDRGLAVVGQGHLRRAEAMAAGQGVSLETTLLAGKPFDRIVEYVSRQGTDLLVTGRFGTHFCDGARMGSTSQNLLFLAPCNQLIVGPGLPSGDQLSGGRRD